MKIFFPAFVKWKISPSKILIGLLGFFLLLFPKGGIKIHDVPITWGYLLLGLLTLFFVPRSYFALSRHRLLMLAFLLPFQVTSILTIFNNGMADQGFTLAFIVSFFLLPWAFFFFFSKPLEHLDSEFLFRMIKKGIFFIACYGIFLFFYKLLIGSFFTIPFLTINYSDIGKLEDTKCIDRGNLFKLISTYNNGNIYGVCLLMLLPLYLYLEKSLLKKVIVKFSLVLTLSRTVWIGLLLQELIYDIYIEKFDLKSIKKIIFKLGGLIAIILLALKTFGISTNFIKDTTFGGRSHQFSDLWNVQFFSDKPFQGIAEIVYLSILKQFGISGLSTFMTGMLAPLALYYTSGRLKSEIEPKRKCIASGLFMYLILCCSDGAMLFIPTMAFYWFLSSLLFKRTLSGALP